MKYIIIDKKKEKGILVRNRALAATRLGMSDRVLKRKGLFFENKDFIATPVSEAIEYPFEAENVDYY